MTTRGKLRERIANLKRSAKSWKGIALRRGEWLDALKAELAEIKTRRCATCVHWIYIASRDRRKCDVICVGGGDLPHSPVISFVFYPDAVFGCTLHEEKTETNNEE